MRIIVRKFTKILKKKNIKIIVREFNFEIDKNKKKKPFYYFHSVYTNEESIRLGR